MHSDKFGCGNVASCLGRMRYEASSDIKCVWKCQREGKM